MAKTKIEKIASIEEEIKQLENKKKRLIQEQKEQERKDRTNRLCKRMGFIEKLLPGTIPLTEEQFKTFVEQTIATEHSRRILDGLTAQNAATAPAQGAGTAGRGENHPAAKNPPTAPEQALFYLPGPTRLPSNSVGRFLFAKKKITLILSMRT